MAKLTEFISQVKQTGLSRTNRYSVIMNPPMSLMTGQNAFAQSFPDIRQLLMFCDQIQLPGLNLSTTQNRTFGEFREVPYEKLYGDLNMQFYVDTDLNVKTFFDTWMASVQDPYTRTFSYYNDYITDITVVVEDLEDQMTYGVTLYECYPKTISPIQMDYASKDIMKLQVAMNFKYWLPENMAKPARGGVNPNSNGNRNFSVPESFLNNFSTFQANVNQVSNTIDGISNFISGLFD